MNNQKYWEERSSNMMRKIYNSQEQKNKILIKNYEKALKELKSDLSELYEKMDNISLSEAYKYDRYNKFVSQIDDRLKELAKEEVKIDKEILINSYTEAAKEVSKNLGISFSKIPIATIEKAILYPWSGSNFSDIIWKNASELAYKVKNVITTGLIKGSSYKDMAKDLNKLMQNGEYNSLRVIRTETAHIVNQSALDRYKARGVKKVQIIVAADERMCTECGDKEAAIYPIDYSGLPPFHPNCRCTFIPIIEGLDF